MSTIDDLRRKLDETKARLARAEERGAATRRQMLRDRLNVELGKMKVDPQRIKFVVGHLVDSAKTVRFANDDDDKIVFTNGGQEVELHAGIKAWAQSEDGRFLLPPLDSPEPRGRGPDGKFVATARGEPSLEQVGARVVDLFPSFSTGPVKGTSDGSSPATFGDLGKAVTNLFPVLKGPRET